MNAHLLLSVLPAVLLSVTTAAQDRPATAIPATAIPATVLDAARPSGSFTTLLAAVDAAGLTGTLSAAGPFTVLAPTDAAFEALGAAAVGSLLADPERLAAVLKAHVLTGRRSATDLVVAGRGDALDGSSWTVQIDGGRVMVGEAHAIATDLEAGNGVVHAIDRVLLPMEPSATAAPAEAYTAGFARALRAERAAAAQILGAALENGADAAELIDAAERAAAELAGHPESRIVLESAARDGRGDGDADALERTVERTLDDLRFRPSVEAELPLGWPETAPIGEVVLKSYPRYRMAQTTMAARGGTTTPFFALFNHIKRNDIAMTAPVQMDYGPDGERRAASMAFLYAHPNQGESGADQRDDRVEVMDIEPMMAISIGGRGYEMAQTTAEMKRRLDGWLRAHESEFEAAGPMRTMGYNSPMVPAQKRFFEVEMPVRRIAAAGD